MTALATIITIITTIRSSAVAVRKNLICTKEQRIRQVCWRIRLLLFGTAMNAQINVVGTSTFSICGSSSLLHGAAVIGSGLV